MRHTAPAGPAGASRGGPRRLLRQMRAKWARARRALGARAPRVGRFVYPRTRTALGTREKESYPFFTENKEQYSFTFLYRKQGKV